jgi:hypothetical protein
VNIHQPFSRPADLDLGHSHYLWFHGWSPDRDLNPQYKNVPDIEKACATVSHPRADGKPGVCWSGINFDGEAHRKLWPDERHRWKVESWDPLTTSPSLLCMECGDHGFIRNGKWVPA